MAFRFVHLSSLKMADVPATSPLRKSNVVIKESNNPSKLVVASDFLFVGLLRVHRTSAATAESRLVCVRQEAVFLSRNTIGIYVPADREVFDYAGVYLQAGPSKSAEEAAKSKEMLVFVEFHSFDGTFVNATHLDLVKNLLSLAPSQPRPIGDGFFFLSNLRLAGLLKLPDHFVGFIEITGRKWPVFLDYGFLCLKLGQLETLLANVPVWIDSKYRIRLGQFSLDVKSQPVVHFTAMRITLPSTFEYGFTTDKELMVADRDKDKDKDTFLDAKASPPPAPANAMAPWDDAAGVSFVPRASNSLSCYGHIPHNFPVMEARPSIVLDSWLPPFVRQIIKDMKKCHRLVVCNINSAARSRGSVRSSKSNSSKKSTQVAK